MSALFERVRELVIEQLKLQEPEKVTPEASLVDDLGADSLDVVDLTIAIEEAFGGDADIEISDEDAEKIRTVQDIVDYLEAQGVS